MSHPENKIYSWKTVAITFLSTYLCAVIPIWVICLLDTKSHFQAFTIFPMILLYFPLGLNYYMGETMNSLPGLIFFHFIYLAIFVTALTVRVKKVFFVILIIWIILLILNVHGCMNTNNHIS
jgi:hypothetical protein